MMRLFQGTRRGGARPVELDTNSDTLSGSESYTRSDTGSTHSSVSSSQRAGVSASLRDRRANRTMQPRSGSAVRRPQSARSGTSSAAGVSGVLSPAGSASPLGFTQGSHLRPLNSGGALVPVTYTGGALVPVRAAGGAGEAKFTSPTARSPQPTNGNPHSLDASLRSMNASMAFANYMADAAIDKKPTMNILVVGAPQVGKSMLVNAYRAAVTNTLKWPTAPVGICGFYGTTSVEPFPNHPTDPTWMCIDTPGRLYQREHEALLEKLVEGMPWKTKLVGVRSMPLAEVKELTPIAANAAHQCIVVVPATDLIEDQGWSNFLWLRSRYVAAPDAARVVLYTKGLVSLLRALLSDSAPFVVITKMDKVGGSNCYAAREAILALMGQCVPTNRVFFAAFPESATALSFKQNITLDQSTRESLVHLHEEICMAVRWKHRLKSM